LPFECEKIAPKNTFFFNKIAKNFNFFQKEIPMANFFGKKHNFGNFFEKNVKSNLKKRQFFGNLFEKKFIFLAIFSHSNGNFPEGQITSNS